MAKARSRVLWSPAAQQDLIDIWGYYARIGSGEVADNILQEIEFAAGRIGIEPRMWPIRTDLMPKVLGGLRSALEHPYAIFYRAEPPDAPINVEIIRVLHQHRDLRSLLSDESV